MEGHDDPTFERYPFRVKLDQNRDYCILQSVQPVPVTIRMAKDGSVIRVLPLQNSCESAVETNKSMSDESSSGKDLGLMDYDRKDGASKNDREMQQQELHTGATLIWSSMVGRKIAMEFERLLLSTRCEWVMCCRWRGVVSGLARATTARKNFLGIRWWRIVWRLVMGYEKRNAKRVAVRTHGVSSDEGSSDQSREGANGDLSMISSRVSNASSVCLLLDLSPRGLPYRVPRTLGLWLWGCYPRNDEFYADE